MTMELNTLKLQAALADAVISDNLEAVKPIVENINATLHEDESRAGQIIEEYRTFNWFSLLETYPGNKALIYALENLELPLGAERAYIYRLSLEHRFSQDNPSEVRAYLNTQLTSPTEGLNVPPVGFYSNLLTLALEHKIYDVIPLIQQKVGAL